jgi:hypothetical protein
METVRLGMSAVGLSAELTFKYTALIAGHPSIGPEESDANLPSVSFKIMLAD